MDKLNYDILILTNEEDLDNEFILYNGFHFFLYGYIPRTYFKNNVVFGVKIN